MFVDYRALSLGYPVRYLCKDLSFGGHKVDCRPEAEVPLQMCAADLAELGKHTRGKGCIYANKLEDIDMSVLERMTRYAWENTKDFDATA